MNRHLKEFLQAMKVIGILCLVTFTIEIIFDSGFSWKEIKNWTFYNFYFGLPFAYGNSIVIKALNKKWPWEDDAKKRAIWGIVISTIFNIALLVTLMVLLHGVYYGKGIAGAFSPQLRGTYLIALIITLVISLIGYSLSFFKKIQEQKIANEKLKEEKTSAELNALKAQVDPHFLFNSFNVLSGLIDEEPEKAQQFLGGLSKIYRYVLENRNEDLSKLSDEVAFAKQYLSLQQTRFEDSVIVSINLSSNVLEKKIPALSLQLLLENAIKHNAFDKEAPLNIEIVEGDNNILVSNNKKSRKQIAKSNGFGLENIEKRYALHKINGFRVEDGQDLFTVTLPLL